MYEAPSGCVIYLFIMSSCHKLNCSFPCSMLFFSKSYCWIIVAKNIHVSTSLQKRSKSGSATKFRGKATEETEDEDEDNEGEDSENGFPDEEEEHNHSENEGKEIESEGDEEEGNDHDDDGDNDSGKDMASMKKCSNKGGSAASEKSKTQTPSNKISLPTSPKTTTKTPPSKRSKSEENKGAGAKVFARKKKNADTPKKPTPKSAPKEKSSGTHDLLILFNLNQMITSNFLDVSTVICSNFLKFLKVTIS